jgi:hypothetical protein
MSPSKEARSRRIEMKRSIADPFEACELCVSEAANVRVGQIVDLNERGEALVDFPGNSLGPLGARSAIGVDVRITGAIAENAPVLLAFENGDPKLPIIVGFVRNTLGGRPEMQVNPECPPVLSFSGRAVTFEAVDQIVLRCGKSSVTLRSDGKVIVKGSEIFNRSSGAHKIKSGTVKIN